MSDDNKQLTSEEVTAKVIKDFGFDVDTQGEQIEKLTNERIESQKNLSKTIEQKAKYREQGVKAGILDPNTFEPIEKKPEGEPLTTNTEQGSATIEHMALLAQDPNVEKVKYAEKVAKVEGITLTEAYSSDLCQSKFSQMDQDAQVQANTMPPSGGSAPAQREKTPANMTDEEHRSYGEAMLAKAINK